MRQITKSPAASDLRFPEICSCTAVSQRPRSLRTIQAVISPPPAERTVVVAEAFKRNEYTKVVIQDN